MDNIPSKGLFKNLITGPMAGLTAAIVGGIFSLGAAILPNLFPAKSDSPPNDPVPPVAAATSPALPVVSAAPRLTYGTWTLLESVDDDGTDWRNSVLKFTGQKPTSDGLEIEGFFEWRNGTTLMGREFVRGNYVASTRNLYFEGKRVENVAGELAVGSFSARLADDERNLVEGSWGDTAGNATGVPGTWRARR